MKTIVIGVNHAGTSFIRTLLTQNKNAEVIAFDRNDNISFLGCGIALTVGGVVKDTNDLFYSNYNELTKMGAKVFMNTEVTSIDKKNKIVKVVDLKTGEKKEYKYDKLVYAGGSWPIDLKAKNSDLENVEVCKLYQHALKLIEKANNKNIKTVTIIGAGYIGLELVEAFHKKGKVVNLIDLASSPLANYCDKEISKYIKEGLEKAKINLYMGQQVVEYIGKTKVEAVKTNKSTIKTDIVIECVGFSPNTSVMKGLKKTKNGALIVNEFCQTSDKNIYAIGDSCAIFDAASRKHRNISLATNAVKSGIVAASNINGNKKVKIDSIVGTNALCVFGLNFASTGLTEEGAKKFGIDVASSTFFDNDRPEWMNEYGLVGVKIVFDKKTLRLVGAQIISFGEYNHTEWIMALGLAIQKSMTILELAFMDVYFLPHYNKPFNFLLGSIMNAIGLNYVKGVKK